MKKILSLTLSALLAGSVALSSVATAEAHYKKGRYHKHSRGVGVAAGVIGGLIIGGAIANANRRSNYRHCHFDYCHRHAARYSDHAHERTVYEPPRRRRPRRRRASSAHVDWCFDRYRSYREWDNTFQPYNGGRRRCLSPYN